VARQRARDDERRRTAGAAAPESAPDRTAPDAVRALQRGAGNAAVTAWLARRAHLSRQPVSPAADPIRELWGRDAVCTPHDGGGVEGALGLLDPDPGTADWLGDVLGLPTSAPAAPATAPPAVDKAVTDWRARAPTTNAEYAQWVLDGEGLGFVTFTPSMGSKAQMTDLAAGKKVSGVDPGQAAVLGGLFTIHALVDARAGRWVADPKQDKAPLMVGSFIRSDGHRGQAIDLNGLDFAGAGGPAQVAALLQDLPKGSYGIGLPFQGQFFPADQQLKRRMSAAEAKAGEGTPEAITTPSLERFTTNTYTASWNAEKHTWDTAVAGDQAVGHLRSADLRKAIGDLNKAGYSIYVFPDNDSHIHVQH
jgi:hypothetical protein